MVPAMCLRRSNLSAGGEKSTQSVRLHRDGAEGRGIGLPLRALGHGTLSSSAWELRQPEIALGACPPRLLGKSAPVYEVDTLA